MKYIFIIGILLFVFGCAHAPDCVQIQEKVYEHENVDAFTNWLEAQPGVWDVEVNKLILLTSSPPKVVITYSDRSGDKELLIAVEPDQKLTLVKPE